ncbi:MAG: GNAT family N-acetyltransferase [Dokdonella sp.]|uniref:GNAT family N-acetyltransferase n=1 Tax=Dokdonella sp. TaxID=2291710 RepID=UPI0025BC7146|nr:GNAT family N-acetyltransferase [Dokdonella sp.]MBZ0222922.1 GNAT family N-acetyltransferase [Dokdonella sp.]
MAVRFRDVTSHDLDSVLALNNAAGPTILPLGAAALRDLYDQACYFRVAEVDGHVAGFLVALNQDAAYDSPNFRWFAQRYPRFVYIDRIVVARGQRGLGLGRVFYADVTSYAETRSPVLTCEVFLEPRDDVSLLFHGTSGFVEVGQQVMPANDRRVALLAKTLCSYPFVADTYLQVNGGHLPDLPWLREREHVQQGAAPGTRLAGGA